jgi:cytochrome bd-type quinol oxidase subunit 2
MGSALGIFSAFGLSASAGLNAYIPLLVIALTARFTELIKLNSPWDALTSWWIIGLLVVLSIVEFLVDKFPVVNHINDIFVQSIVRPAAGAIVFAASTNVISDVHPILAIALGILVAGSVNLVKSAAVRPAVSAVSGTSGNVPVSVAEDATSTTLSVLSVAAPTVVGILLVLLGTWLLYYFFLRPPAEKD